LTNADSISPVYLVPKYSPFEELPEHHGKLFPDFSLWALPKFIALILVIGAVYRLFVP